MPAPRAQRTDREGLEGEECPQQQRDQKTALLGRGDSRRTNRHRRVVVDSRCPGKWEPWWKAGLGGQGSGVQEAVEGVIG